jgi:seryl-tRNA synthetase
MSRTDDVYKPALSGKKIPLLPLDNKWYKLMSGYTMTEQMVADEEEIKELLKKQGRLNTSVKELKKKKNHLMAQIVGNMDEDSGSTMDDIKEQIEECNRTMDEYMDELIDIPKLLNEINYRLMLGTMELCYDSIKTNTDAINEIGDWIDNIRKELKLNVVRKQEKEYKNQQIYSYMHDIFGADVIDIFDMKYNPESEHVIK